MTQRVSQEAEKACKTCGLTKPLSEYYSEPVSRDNHRHYCKVCDRASTKKWEQDKPERARAKRKRYLKRHPSKTRARYRLTKAVAEGRVQKPTACEDCGREMERRFIHGHHTDYSKPFEVAWVCAKCHAARHREERNVAA